MGNRAILVTEGDTEVGIYLHWNGGPESVLAFLAAAKQLGVRDPVQDPDYFRARLVQLIGNYLGGTVSVGVGLAARMDNGDNGRYVIGHGFVITKRDNEGAMTVAGLENHDHYDAVLAECLAKNKVFA